VHAILSLSLSSFLLLASLFPFCLHLLLCFSLLLLLLLS
jgi:hypothetical protein